MPSLADLGGPAGGMPPAQDAKIPGCHIAMCVSILNAFGVSFQFGPLQIYSLDPPIHAIETNVAMNAKKCNILPCSRLILNLVKYAYFKLFIINKKYTLKTTAVVGFEPGSLAWNAKVEIVEPTRQSTYVVPTRWQSLPI